MKRFQIPTGFSDISSGTLLPDGKTLVTGHDNGYVVRWGKGASDPDVLLRSSSRVNAVACSEEGSLFVGSDAGDFYYLKVAEADRAYQIRPPSNSKAARIGRISAIAPNSALVTFHYGTIRLFELIGENWNSTKLRGHSHTATSVASSGGHLLATGDYRGNIVLWERPSKEFCISQRLLIDSGVRGLTFLNPCSLAAVGQSGRIYLFGRQNSDGTWRTASETDSASGEGVAISSSADHKSILVATAEEIINLNPTSQEIQLGRAKGAISIFFRPDAALVLTGRGLLEVPLSELKPRSDFATYGYLKVGLLGDTATGKSTLCSAITTGNSGGVGSTFGHRIWTWNTRARPPIQRVLFNDNGGQEQVVRTLLPLATDSDIVLFLFKQTDAGSLRRAIEIRNRLKPQLRPSTRSYLVETFTDDKLKAVTDAHLNHQVAREGFDGAFKVNPTNPDDVKRFKRELTSVLDWKRARPVIQSQSAEGVARTIAQLKREGTTIATVEEISTAFERVTGSNIYLDHLKFLLENLNDEGEVDYYPDVGNLVVLDDPSFNALRTNIPVFIGERGGLVRRDELHGAFPDAPKFVQMLAHFYQVKGIAILFSENQVLVFPTLLADREIDLSSSIADSLRDSVSDLTFESPNQDSDVDRLLLALSDLGLECIDVSQREGIFSRGSRAILYYNASHSRSALEGSKLRISLRIGGTDPEARAALESQIRRLLQAVFGASSSVSAL